MYIGVNIVSCCLLHSEVEYILKICYFHTLHVEDSLNSHRDMVIDMVDTYCSSTHSQGKCLPNCDPSTDHIIRIDMLHYMALACLSKIHT